MDIAYVFVINFLCNIYSLHLWLHNELTSSFLWIYKFRMCIGVSGIAVKTVGKVSNDEGCLIITSKQFIQEKGLSSAQLAMLLLFIQNISKSILGFIPVLSLINARWAWYPLNQVSLILLYYIIFFWNFKVCGKAFNSRDNRNAHRFVHSDKKPYECLVCGMGFMRKPLLYNHMQQAVSIS